MALHESQSFSNNRDGISMKATKSVYIANSLIGANGMHGIRVEKGETNEKRELNLFGVNITGHFLNPAVQLDECSWMEIYLNHCHIYDNHDGALIVDGRSDTCEINVFNGNFTRNRGPTLHMSSLNRGTVHLESNSFTNNHMNARADREALINLELGTGAGIVVTDNQFVKNTMESVVKLAQRDRTPPTVVIAKNTFYNNLAFNVIYADVQNANISYNLLYNQQSNCEITSGPQRKPLIDDVQLNQFEKEPLLRVCAIDAGASEAALYLPFANYSGPLFIGETQPTPPFTHLYNTFVNNGRPYLITQDLVIPEGKVVIIEPGTTLKFSSGAKMVVKGKLYANGSLSRPIRLLANDETNPWGGVVLSENSTATLSDVLISNAIDGIHVETPNMQMERITIENTRKNGIVIGESGGSDLDFGHSTIRRVSQNAVLVEERNESLAIRNLRIEDSSATGFTYEKPKKNLTLENVQLSNLSPPENGYSIKLFDDPAKKLERFELRNVSVMNQKFGSGGIFYEGSAGVVDVFGGNFQANSVPALGFKFKCHEIPSNLHVIGANFVENTDAPLRIELGECASAQILYNTFERNSGKSDRSLVDVSIAPKFDGNPISEILLYANKFNGNTASKSTLSLENQSGKSFNGTIFENIFSRNVNNEAVIEVNSGDFRIVSNELRDPKTPREVLYSGEKKLDLTNNFWGTQLVQEIKPKIGCIGKCQDLSKVDIIPPRGSLIDITPIDISTIGRESSACAGGCGGHGTCTLSGCLCNGGYSGKDCQEILPPVCMIACAHGSCSGSLCSCYAGWMGVDCSLALCPELRNCSNHGYCTSSDRCFCDAGYTGPDCSIEMCSPSNCFHGNCSTGNCACDEGWHGKRCRTPICSTRCSFNGICSSPEQCQCFIDYRGPTCNECSTEDCVGCDPPCEHGECDPIAKTCICHDGWKGISCGDCPSNLCQSKPSIAYILPQTVDVEETNLIVSVHGKNFPRASEYSCIFGTLKAPGKFVSSSLVRCAIPEEMSIGRHVFTLEPETTHEHIESVDEKPIHFTFTERISQKCQGSDLGPLCVCAIGKSGADCAIIELIAQIDRQFITNQRANEGAEGTPYLVKLPLFENSVIQVSSTAPGLQFDSSKNLIVWENPIGSTKPYNISLSIWNANGPNEIDWPLKVPPSYKAKIEGFEMVGSTQKRRIFGRIDKPLPNRPVILQIRRDAAKSEEFLVETDENGFFSSEYTPDWNFGGKYHVSASHPGEVKSVDDHFEISWSTPNIEVTYNERPTRDQLKSGVEYLVENVGEVAISGWKLQIASGNLSIDSVEQSTKSLEFREGARVLVKYSMIEDFSGPFTVLLVTDSGLTRVIRQEVPMRRVLKSLSSTPKSLIVPLIFNALPTVQIHLDTTDTKISSPLQLGFETRPEPFYLIGSDPPLSNYAEYSANDRGLTLFLGGTPDGSRVNGTIHILYRGDIILRIPYTFSRRETDLFPLAICLQDEQYSEFSSIKTNAQIELVNSTNGVVMNPRSAIVNGSPQIFTIYPGFYQLTVTADQHQTYEEAIYVTPSNDSFCVRLATKVTNIMPIFNGKHFSIDKIAKNQISPIPQVILFPSFITEKTEEIEAFIDGHLTKETYVYFDEIKTQFLNIKASTSAISVGDSAKIQVDAHSLNDLFKDQCDAIIFNVPYHISKNNSVDILHNTQVIVGKTEQARKLCDENLQSVSLAVKTSIQCNCANGVRENCRQKYTSAMGCGGGWKMIADDTVSLENFAMILHLVAECQQMRIYFDELKGSISCIASLDAECPLSNRLKREISESEEKKWLEDNQIPAFEPRMTSRKMKSIEISDQWDSSFTKALDVQAISFAAQFLEFFERFEEIFPLPTLKSFPTRFWNEFFQSIADHSENGMKISEGENEKLLGNVQNGDTFLKLWNNSVSEWASGRIRPFEDSSPHPLIKYSQLKALIAAADKLKSISRQNGAPDPFAMLHAYMGQVLSTAGLDEADLCAESHIIIEPNVVDEGEIIVLTVNFENLKPTFLNAIRLEIEWVRGDVYTPEVKFAPGIFSYTGIYALDGSQSLPGKSSFQAIAKYTTAPGPHLTREVVYQPIVIVSFENGEKKSIQKLQSFPVTIRPKPALKVHYFIQQEKASHFVYVIFVNNGYVTLKNVRVINFKVGYEKANKEPTRFRIDEMRIDGIQKNGGLSYELGMIKPGKTKVATFRVFPLDNEGFLHSIQSQTLVDERLLPFEENKPLAIRWILEKGLIVSPLESEEPRFYFDQKAATISNIIELQNIKKTSSDSNVNGRLYHRISTVFMNPESQSFRGVFLGKILLSTMAKNFKLIRLNEVGSKLTNIQRNLNGPKWIQKENGVDYLNFIDSTALMALPSNTISYEAIFADPNDFPTPIFEQNLYRIQVHPDSWPIPGTSIGSISAFSPIDSPLEFSLYSSIGDETFSIDKNTGEIFVENELRKNEEQCVIVEVKDQHGNSATVPLSINSGGQQKSCVSRGVSGMKPLIHNGETVETSPPTESPWVSFPTPGLLSTPDVTSPDVTMETPDVTTENFETSTFQTEITENENHSSETSQATASQETTRKQDETEISTWETTVTNGHTEIIHSITPDNEPTEWTTSTIRTAITTQAIESTTESITFYTNRPDGEPSTLSPTDFPTPDILTTETGETTVDSGEIHSTMMLTPDETPEPITRITPVEQTASSTETFTHTVETSTFSTTSFEQTTEFIHTIQPDSTPISIDPITATSMETLATSGVPMVTLTDDFPKPPTPAWQTGRWSSSTITSPVSITFSTVSETFETTSLSEQDQAIQHACGQKDEGIWDLICDLSKLTRGHHGVSIGNQSTRSTFETTSPTTGSPKTRFNVTNTF